LIGLSVIFAFLGQLLMQSAFFIWWEGTGTFGSRTFSGVSVLIFYSLLKFKEDIKLISLNHFYIFLVFLIAIYQSYMLGLGETSFKNLNSFFTNKQDLFDRVDFQKNNEILFFSIILILLFSFCLKITFQLKKIFFLIWFLTLITFLSYLTLLLFQYFNRPYLLPLILLTSFLITKYYEKIFLMIFSFYKKLSHLISLYIFLAVFIISIFFQITLFSQLKAIASDSYIGGKKFNCAEWVGSYKEYLQIPGYNYEKSVLLNFLKKNKCFIIK
jgi:hypothetical protein